MSTKHEVAVELAGGKRLVFETGRMAKQASGAALVTYGRNRCSGHRSGFSRSRGKGSISFRSRWITASTHTPADAFPADSSSAKAGPAKKRF